MSSPASHLCAAHEATFWPRFSWPDFAAWPERGRTLVVVPIAGFADWGLGHALDAEETVLMHVLRGAAHIVSREVRLLVLPPLRFVAGPKSGCAFAIDAGTAHDLIAEVVGSVAAAGFRRVVLFNASPWNEELCDAAARDLRIDAGLGMFCVNLSALALDFHPTRSRDREKLRTLLDALTAGAAGSDAAAGHFAALLREIAARPPLPREGALKQMREDA